MHLNISTSGTVIGTWRSGNVFNTHELTIDKNGTFTYQEQTCNGELNSHGYWTKHNDALILKSSSQEPKSSLDIFRNSKAVCFNYERLIVKGNTLTLFDYSGGQQRMYVRAAPYSSHPYRELSPPEQISIHL